MSSEKVIYRFHAIRRMFERKITEFEVLEILATGKVIEDYPNDLPYPSRLLMGQVSEKKLHVVIAEARVSQEIIIITVYEPDLDTWEPGFEVRRKS